jgi:hypothetical protein
LPFRRSAPPASSDAPVDGFDDEPGSIFHARCEQLVGESGLADMPLKLMVTAFSFFPECSS